VGKAAGNGGWEKGMGSRRVVYVEGGGEGRVWSEWLRGGMKSEEGWEMRGWGGRGRRTREGCS